MLQATTDPLELLPAETYQGWVGSSPAEALPQLLFYGSKVKPEKCRLVEGHAAKSELVFLKSYLK